MIDEFLKYYGYILKSKFPNSITDKNIFYCEDIYYKELCVVKILDKSTQKSYNEFLISVFLKKNKHKNVVDVKDVFEMRTKYIIVTKIYNTDLFEYLKMKQEDEEQNIALPNASLFEHLKCESNIEEKINIMLDILSGLKFLHKNDIIYNDLKPENIFLNFNKSKINAVIADFDCSGINKQCRIDGGTDGYLAPEVYKDFKNASFKSDIYSLGKLIGDLFAGCKCKKSKNTISNLVKNCLEIEKNKRPSLDEIEKIIKSL